MTLTVSVVLTLHFLLCVLLCCAVITGDRLYIVMELIEGVPLSDHFTSLKEKQQRFTEDRVWNIFIQVCMTKDNTSTFWHLLPLSTWSSYYNLHKTFCMYCKRYAFVAFLSRFYSLTSPQLCLALRYLHKEKRIVHRDLSPNNIMLGEKDKVTIS